MVNRPSTPEIITVNSEALQTQIRDLLPSQNGFGSELQATNVITPIIDLTAAAEGSGLGVNLQTALAFGSQTAFDVQATTLDIANSPGFYRVVGTSVVDSGSGATEKITAFIMTDGFSAKNVWKHVSNASEGITVTYDLVFWVDVGVTLQAFASAATSNLAGSIRQIADSQGQSVNPSGYPL
jgi:hypothetical protein